ncbi:MAG: diaminopropionate ammonia-lyase [Ignavibacteria bacterium]
MIFFNPFWAERVVIEPPDRAPLAFHRQLPHYSPTPLHRLDELARALGVKHVLLKDESHRLGLPAFKILGASWAVYRALCDRFPTLREPWQNVEERVARLQRQSTPIVYAATDGNHGRAVAHIAALLGLHARISVPQGTAAARIAAIESEGASVHVVLGTYGDAVADAVRNAQEHHGLLVQDSGWEGYETIPQYVVAGYSTMLWEIDDALRAQGLAQPTHVIVQIGVGSLAEAVVRHYCRMRPSPIIIGVEPEGAACALESVKEGRVVRIRGPHTSIMAGMNCDSSSRLSFPILQKGMRCFLTISDTRAIEAMRLLASWEIVSGETGAAGAGALLELASDEHAFVRSRLGIDRDSSVLIFSTEGATNPALYAALVGASPARS